MRASFSNRLPWPAPENALAQLAAERRRHGLPVHNLSASNPSVIELPRESRGLLEPFLQPENLRYEPDPRGLSVAREALSADLFRRGLSSDPSRLFLTASTSEAYGWLFKLLCVPGEAVLVPKPGYPLFDYLAGLEAVEARPYRLEYAHPRGWRIDFDSLEKAAAEGCARAIVLINPNNPTGSYLCREERERLVELAARRGLALVVDEVFFDFPLEAAERRSFVGEDRVLCFVLDGLSKSLGLPQFKLGWISASGPGPELGEALGRLEILADTYLSASTPVMNALPSLLELGPAFRELLGARLRENLALIRTELEYAASPHRVLRTEGGWNALLEAPRFLSEEALAEGLLRERGILAQPGYFFDMEREAYFSASLILPTEALAALIRAYRSYFDSFLG